MLFYSTGILALVNYTYILIINQVNILIQYFKVKKHLN